MAKKQTLEQLADAVRRKRPRAGVGRFGYEGAPVPKGTPQSGQRVPPGVPVGPTQPGYRR